METTNNGQFKKGERNYVKTEFTNGFSPWNKGINTGISPNNKKESCHLICKNCSKNFNVQPYRKDTAKFCSHSCKAIFNMSGEKHHGWKGGKPKCLNCGELVTQYNARRCLKHKGMSGVNNPRWISDRSLIKIGARNMHDPLTKQWRKEVKDRDRWACRIADNNCDGKLEVHHILLWSEFPELRYETNNGITLCHAHHPRARAEEKRLIPTFNELVSMSVSK